MTLKDRNERKSHDQGVFYPKKNTGAHRQRCTRFRSDVSNAFKIGNTYTAIP